MNSIVIAELKRVLQPSNIISERITDHDRKFLVINLMYFFDNDYNHLFKLLSTFIQIQEIAKDGGVPIAKEILAELEILETEETVNILEQQEKRVVEHVFIGDNEKRSFFRIMLEEKGLDDELIEVEHEDTIHKIGIDLLIDLMESVEPQDQKKIEETMRKIDFLNGDMMHYLNHLATGYVVTHY